MYTSLVHPLTRQALEERLAAIDRAKICLVGDFCLDLYWHADMRLSELSRETPHYPLPIVEERFSPGGAGNVACNIAALRPAALKVVGLAGTDWRGDLLLRALAEHGIDADGIVRRDEIVTNTYIKPIRHGISDVAYEDPRLDFENRSPLPPDCERALLDALERAAADADVICVSDQMQFGCVTPAVRQRLCRYGEEGRTVVVDSRDRAALYHHVIVKPNEVEAVRAFGDLSEASSTRKFAAAGRGEGLPCEADGCASRREGTPCEAIICAGMSEGAPCEADGCASRREGAQCKATVCSGRSEATSDKATVCSGRSEATSDEGTVCESMNETVQREADGCASRREGTLREAVVCTGRSEGASCEAADANGSEATTREIAADAGGSEGTQCEATICAGRSEAAAREATICESRSEAALREAAGNESRSEATPCETTADASRREGTLREVAAEAGRSEAASCEATVRAGRSEGAPREAADCESRSEAAAREATICESRNEAVGGGSDAELERLSRLAAQISLRNGRLALVTLGARGCFVAERGAVTRCPACAVEPPIDFCGAGDTFLAGFGSLLAGGATPLQAVQGANLCSAVTIQKIGTTGTATREEVLRTWEKFCAPKA